MTPFTTGFNVEMIMFLAGIDVINGTPLCPGHYTDKDKTQFYNGCQTANKYLRIIITNRMGDSISETKKIIARLKSCIDINKQTRG